MDMKLHQRIVQHFKEIFPSICIGTLLAISLGILHHVSYHEPSSVTTIYDKLSSLEFLLGIMGVIGCVYILLKFRQ